MAACSDPSYVVKYDFFKHIDDYLEFETTLDGNFRGDKYTENCNFIESNYRIHVDQDNIPKVMDVCKKFVYLTELVINREKELTYDDNDNDNDYFYLNFWLNTQINKIYSNNICKKSFFQNLVSHNNSNNKLSKLKGNIRDIEENELNDMNTLYILYKNYNEIKKILRGSNSNKEHIIEKAKKCVEEYKKLNDKCSGNGKNFCETLISFKNKYDEIELCQYKFAKWTKKKLPSLTDDLSNSLPECETSTNVEEGPSAQGSDEAAEDIGDASDFDMHNITIGAVSTLGLSFIFFVLYKYRQNSENKYKITNSFIEKVS
ncbi:PIR Superfamily Protein [Plasmodium ovale wallikeri]|uniref:PIR Superfamily Protein n=1 Tax=Plasmodium ovale wallikeri TaxID=864142 RepID=A0A1A9AFA0_PLAOA|nr:PIR Superfamily Protein [Plasmodium ovale wallikeri]